MPVVAPRGIVEGGKGHERVAVGSEHPRVGGAGEHGVARAGERDEIVIGLCELRPLAVGTVLPHRVAVDDGDPRAVRPRAERVDAVPCKRVITVAG